MTKLAAIPTVFSLLVVGTLAAAEPQAKGKKLPDAGTVFHLSPTAPKFATCDLEFRDPSDKLWPQFVYGKPAAAGTFTFDAARPKVDFSLLCDQLAQKNGDQSRRVLGDLTQGGKPLAFVLTVKALAPLQLATVESVDAKGKVTKKTVEQFPFEGEFAIGGRKTTVKGLSTVKYSYAKNAEQPDALTWEGVFLLTGQELGLQDPKARVTVRASARAYLAPNAAK